LVIWYFVAPLDRHWTALTSVVFGVSLVVIGAIVVGQVRAVARAPNPRLRAAGVLLVSLPLLIVLFAAAYVMMSHDRPNAFTERLSRVDGLYFAMTVFATVGFGDIVPQSQPARLLVLVQMLANLGYVGFVVRALVEAARRRP
jgi:hypothetical protein